MVSDYLKAILEKSLTYEVKYTLCGAIYIGKT